MVSIVSIGNEQYMVDTGFGANGPIQPLRLNREAEVAEHISPAHNRLMWKSIANPPGPEQRLWCLQVRINDEADWQELYCFPELACFPSDFEVFNFRTSQHPRSLFVRELVCVKMIFSDDESKIIGTIILQEVMKRRELGETILRKKFENEDERIQALVEEFGINLTTRQQAAIRGLGSAIRTGGTFTSLR
jgi:arylamine N-acetyltransferase